jgi:biofilm PGA synthesis N-glycosyltransferase PgaC
MTLSYALVTPARNEAENLERLGSCIRAQTVQPLEWLIVDDGSTDATAEIAAELAHEPWVHVLASRGAIERQGTLEDGRRAGRDMIAFKTGLSRLASPPDVAFKLDADVSMADDYFERLLQAFADDPRLGIAGGTCYELDEHRRWRPYRVTGGHVRGATRAYRWACLEEVSPLEERIGWEAVEEARAALKGWRTRTLDELPFFHHRRLGERDGAWRAWVAQGHLAHHLGYRVPFTLLKIAYRMRREPAAVAMLWGWAAAARRRDERHFDAAVRRYIRGQQSLRRLPGRIGETLKWPA